MSPPAGVHTPRVVIGDQHLVKLAGMPCSASHTRTTRWLTSRTVAAVTWVAGDDRPFGMRVNEPSAVKVTRRKEWSISKPGSASTRDAGGGRPRRWKMESRLTSVLYTERQIPPTQQARFKTANVRCVPSISEFMGPDSIPNY